MFNFRTRLLSLLLVFAAFSALTACDSNEAEDPNADIPADPDAAPPPPAAGPLIPTITLGEVDPDNPARIPLVIGGVAYDEDTGSLRVVDYDDENLTLVVDGVVQGTLISESDESGLKADIAFVVDNTSSMGSEISGVRGSILTFLAQIEAAGQDIAAGIVAFGDEIPDGFAPGVPPGDTRARPAVYGFVDLDGNVSAQSPLYQFVQTLPAADPGSNTDFPELALAGLDFARRTFSWRPDAQRIYILITDDAAWGRGYAMPNDKGIDEDYFTAEGLGMLVRDAGSVVHVYSPDFSGNPPVPPAYDVRTLADLTGGIWTELDRSGMFDLTELGIIETTLASSLVEMVRDDDDVRERTVRAHVRVMDGGRVVDGERTVSLTF